MPRIWLKLAESLEMICKAFRRIVLFHFLSPIAKTFFFLKYESLSPEDALRQVLLKSIPEKNFRQNLTPSVLTPLVES